MTTSSCFFSPTKVEPGGSGLISLILMWNFPASINGPAPAFCPFLTACMTASRAVKMLISRGSRGRDRNSARKRPFQTRDGQSRWPVACYLGEKEYNRESLHLSVWNATLCSLERLTSNREMACVRRIFGFNLEYKIC